jgi:hypothetical protein
MAGSRPGGVTLVSILAWISGIIAIIAGVLGLIALQWTIGAISLVLGIITVAVGAGLWRGSRVARVIATIVFVIDVVDAVWTIVIAPSSFWPSLVAGLLAFIGLVFLYTRAANQFFRG